MSVLQLHRSLYSADAIQAAAAAYAEFADAITVTESEVEYSVTFTAPDPDVPELLDAFANHVLFETAAARTA
ncbi:MAG: hypothetical protein GY898_00905 [Proteobacteria bacterium]|nr:hypothetical protein [Pseudomonadota bacterium]